MQNRKCLRITPNIPVESPERNNCRKLRIAADLTIEHLAKKAGLTVSQLSLLERGSSSLKKTAFKVCKALDIKLIDAFPLIHQELMYEVRGIEYARKELEQYNHFRKRPKKRLEWMCRDPFGKHAKKILSENMLWL